MENKIIDTSSPVSNITSGSSDNKNNKLINWNALLYWKNIKSVLLVILIILVVYLFFNKKNDTTFLNNVSEYLSLVDATYFGQLENLNNKIDLTQESISAKLIDFDNKQDSTFLVSLQNDVENLNRYKNEIERLKKARSNLLSSINAYKDEPFITFVDTTKSDIVISKNEIKILVRFLLGLSEQMRDNRFEIKTIDSENNNSTDVFLFDKSLGSVWKMNEKRQKFDFVEIENLVKERRNNEVENIIDIIIERTGGIIYDITPKPISVNTIEGEISIGD